MIPPELLAPYLTANLFAIGVLALALFRRDAARWKCCPVSVASHGTVVGVSTRSPMQK